MSYVARVTFTTTPEIGHMLMRSADERNTVSQLNAITFEWAHYPDERGRGTKPGNEWTDFTRWAGAKLLTRVTASKPTSKLYDEVTVRAPRGSMRVTRR